MTGEDVSQRRREADYDDRVHWEITRQHVSDIAELKESNARQEEVLSSVLRDVSSTREDIGTLIQKVSEPPPATDLAKLIGTGVAVLGMFGALVYAYVNPMREWQISADEQFHEITGMHFTQNHKNGVIEAEMKAVKQHLEKALGE